MKKINISIIVLLCSLFFGCVDSVSSLSSQELRAREDFANNISQNYPFRVDFSAGGKDKEILEITVIEEVSAYAASGTVDLILSDKLKRDAKALKFKQIHIEGGRKSFGDPDTINRTIDLR
jgi:hypothetical protein